jgi:TPR repeat protein
VGAEGDQEKAQLLHALSILVAYDEAKKANKVWSIDYRSLLAIAHAESTGNEAEQHFFEYSQQFSTALHPDTAEQPPADEEAPVPAIGGSCEASVMMYQLLADQTFRDQKNMEGGLPMIEALRLEDEEHKGSHGFSAQRGKDDNTMTYHEARAGLGDPSSMFWLGQQFYFGRGGIERSIKTARMWFEQAMRHGSPGAFFNLGVMLMNGEGGGRDEVEALKLFEEAAQQGHIGAQNALGNTFWHGTPAATQNQSRGLEFWEKAAALGNVEALVNCAQIYQSGVDSISPPIIPNARKSLEYLGKAAAMGDLLAMIKLGKAYTELGFLHTVCTIDDCTRYVQ